VKDIAERMKRTVEENERAELLKDEYIMLQHFYEEIDAKGLTIKGWSITVALATIGTGILYRREILLVGFLSALVFWYLEAHWRGLSHFFSKRIKDIEMAFESEKWKETPPLQVYATWDKEYRDRGDQTLRYMRKQSSYLPHTVIAVVCLLIFILM
jgi:hypothetical protein